MDGIMKQVIEIARQQLLNQDVSEHMEALKHQYGMDAVTQAIREAGFYCILKKYIDAWETEKQE